MISKKLYLEHFRGILNQELKPIADVLANAIPFGSLAILARQAARSWLATFSMNSQGPYPTTAGANESRW